MKRLIAECQYNIHDIVNRLYRTVPLVPIGDLMQDIAQDIQTGMYDDCGDPNVNWEAWKTKCTDILSERGIVNVMGPRGFIDGNAIVSEDCLYVREARLKKKANEEYSWHEVCDITNNAGGHIYSSPFGNYEGRKFKLEKINIKDIPENCYLTFEQCCEDDLDEDRSVIERLVIEYENGAELPPIILDENNKIIDGSHRIGVYKYLNIGYIMAFILQKKGW